MEMSFNHRAIIIGVNLTHHTNPQTSQHIVADVVLIDKSHGILHPLLYQLRGDALHAECRNDYISLDMHTFAMLGEVFLIDKSKKLIYLKNEITVSYRHLILASGLSQTSLGSIYEEELSAGFHALTEALRVSSHVAQLLHLPLFDSFQKQHKTPTVSFAKQKEEPSFLTLMKSIPTFSDQPSLRSERRLYEVHL